MKQANTKIHWTALAVARYYEKHETACRLRDIYPMVDDIFEGPRHLGMSLHSLKDQDLLDFIVVKNPDGGKAYAYYPTPITIEELRDVGEPTEFPDGSPVPEDLDVSIPSSRVADEDDVVPPDSDAEAPTYASRPAPTGKTRDSYDTSGISREPDAVIEALDDEYVCDCGWSDAQQQAYAAHVRDCPEYGDEDESDEPDLPPVAKTEIDPSNTATMDELAERFDEVADDALHADLPDVSETYRTLAALARSGDLDSRLARFMNGETYLRDAAVQANI